MLVWFTLFLQALNIISHSVFLIEIMIVLQNYWQHKIILKVYVIPAKWYIYEHLQIGENVGVGGLFREWIIWYVWILWGGNTMLYIMSIFFIYVWRMQRTEQTIVMEHYNCCLLFVKESVDECGWSIKWKTKQRVK